MNDLILQELSKQFWELGKSIGFSKIHTRADRYASKVYLINRHALQIEIDWREYDLFMYVVYLKDGELPNENVIYSYDDGHWCRKFIEDIYHTNLPNVKDRNQRYSQKYLFERFERYRALIENDPQILAEFYESIA